MRRSFGDACDAGGRFLRRMRRRVRCAGDACDAALHWFISEDWLFADVNEQGRLVEQPLCHGSGFSVEMRNLTTEEYSLLAIVLEGALARNFTAVLVEQCLRVGY